MLRILNLPIPLVAAFVAMELPADLMSSAPGWGLGFASAVFLVVYVLKAMGRMPGQGGDRREASFTDEDRVDLKKLTTLLGHRSDEDHGVERLLVMSTKIADTNDEIKEIKKILDTVAGHLEVIARNSNRST